MKKNLLLIYLFSTMSLTACGFHLRDQRDIPLQLNTIAIENTDLQSNLTPQLIQSLQALGVKIVGADQAPIILQITKDQLSQSESTLGTAQQLNAVTLNDEVDFVLSQKNRKESSVQYVKSSTDYFQNANQILGDSLIVPTLQEELIRQNVQKILDYLSSESFKASLENQAAP